MGASSRSASGHARRCGSRARSGREQNSFLLLQNCTANFTKTEAKYLTENRKDFFKNLLDLAVDSETFDVSRQGSRKFSIEFGDFVTNTYEKIITTFFVFGQNFVHLPRSPSLGVRTSENIYNEHQKGILQFTMSSKRR